MLLMTAGDDLASCACVCVTQLSMRLQADATTPPPAPALPVTWALKASVAGICVVAAALLGRQRAAGSTVPAAPWLLFFLGTAISSGLYSAVEARPSLDEVAVVSTPELIAVNMSAVGAWLAGGQLFAMSGWCRPVRAARAALGFRLGAVALLVGLNAAVFTSQPASSRLDVALLLASLGAVGLIAGGVAGLCSPSRLSPSPGSHTRTVP